VVAGDLTDPKYRARIEARTESARRAEAVREEARAQARAAGADAYVNGGLAGSVDAGTGNANVGAGAAAATGAPSTPVQYERRDVIDDTAFIAEQMEGLRKCGGLVPGAELSAPPIVATFKTLLQVKTLNSVTLNLEP